MNASILPADSMRSPARRLLFINRSYWPDAEATGQLLTDLCQSLSSHYEVHVLCGQPNSNPTGAEFIQCGTQVHESVTIHRLRHTQFAKRRPGGRVINLISFTLAARRWLGRCGQFDAVIAETDPFLLPLVTAPFARRRGIPYVAYLQDIYPDIAIRLGVARDSKFTRWLRSRLAAAYHTAARVVVLSPGMKHELVGWGLPDSKIEIVPNWVDCQSIQPCPAPNPLRQQHAWDQSQLVVMYSGNMGMSQKLDRLIAAVDDPHFPLHARLVLVGGGADELRLKQLASQSKTPDRITFLPYQPREHLGVSLSAADLHVISVDPRIGGTMMPSKLYGILAAGRPSVVIADPASDVAQLVADGEVGVIAPSHEPADIAQAVARFAALDINVRNEMHHRARVLAEQQYDRSICVEQFRVVMEGLWQPGQTQGLDAQHV